MSVKRAQQEIDAEEFQWWQAFYRLEPWGETRADLRMGILASVQANVYRGKDTEAFTPQDFMPNFEASSDEPDDDELDALIAQQEMVLESLASSLGGIVK